MAELAMDDLRRRIENLRKQYDPGFQAEDDYSSDLFRIRKLYRRDGILIDLGGGISAHNGVLAQLGMAVYVIDMLGDYWEHRDSGPSSINREVRLLEACGVKFLKSELCVCDVRTYFAEESVDVIASFHSIEHLHGSPRVVLESGMRVLKPGGRMIIEVPNAVNLRKRLAVVTGRTNYGSYNSMYYGDPFIGHVREYTTGDLHQLARNIGVADYRISGTNTIYGDWAEKVPPALRSCLDRSLRVFPGLCSALLLEMTKQNGARQNVQDRARAESQVAASSPCQ